MYFLFTTLRNVQAATLVELLQRLARVFKDYCGVITEESVRRNFLLLYELLDEVFDRGIPQVDYPASCMEKHILTSSFEEQAEHSQPALSKWLTS